ncbi:MAG: lipopolysaccharide biosynthesis protein [Candidatus Aminicenantes bacterium]|nr:lipopolysaccharide biosynthesis protein [Candidatus Aminicenantes bacterium]
MDNLESRVVRSGAWVFGMRFVHQVFYLGRLIILARLLAPKDFGLMGIALLTMMTLETFSQTGFQEALIQKKKNTEEYLDSAWTVLVIRGIILFSIIVLIAPLVARFFETPQAKGVVQAIGLAILIQAFTNVGVVYFQKELEFNKQFIYITAGTVTDFAVAVTAAILMRSVWALLFGLVAGKLAQLIVSYIIHPYRPCFRLEWNKARELFKFGKWIFGSSIIYFLLFQGDDIFVGKLLGATALGFYQIAYKISNTPATEITKVISQVTFPVYSKIQENLSTLKEFYLKSLQLISFLSFFLAGLIFAFAPEFTRFLLGEKWVPIIPIIQALSIFGVTSAINGVSGPIFQGIGKPKVNTIGALLQFIFLVLLIYPFTIKWGLLGTSIAIAIPNFFYMLVINKLVSNELKYRYMNFIKLILIPFLGSLMMAVIIIIMKSFVDSSIIGLVFSFIVGVGFGLLATYILDKDIYFNLRYLVFSVISEKKQ